MSLSSTNPVICPICSAKLASLTLLNTHLDTLHASSTPTLLSWLKTQSLTPYSTIKSLTTHITTGITSQLTSGLNASLGGMVVNSNADILRDVYGRTADEKFDADEYIAKDCWVVGEDACCMWASCVKRVGIVNGKVNCRKYIDSLLLMTILLSFRLILVFII
jgi:hypothetical protein